MARPESPGATSYKIHVVGAARQPWLRDAYHFFLRISWPAALGLIVAAYLAVNLAFAGLYLAVGGVAGAARGSLFDAFSFSVQTLGTIGYGAMYPQTRAAQALVIVESVAGLLVMALATGLVFAKFSQPTGRIAFARHVTLGPMDGVPTLMFRVGNERRNHVVEAQVRVVLMRTVKTREGVTFYRMEDVPLTRDRSPAMNRSWTVMHPIDERSPLYGATPASLARDEVEFLVTLVGVDDTSFQPVHARRTYEHHAIVWGARHADVLSEDAKGDLVLDLGRFHEIVSTEATEAFPYAWQSRGDEPVRRSVT
jgi:inward rectifier potassium channel